MTSLTQIIAASLLAIGASTAAGATTIANAPDGNSVSSFGTPDSLTYGEVFTAPVTATLTSFTLTLNGAVGDIEGGVGTWNGPAAFGTGYGSPTNLYLSAATPSLTGANSFSPDVGVVAGQQYVAYITAYGLGDAPATTSLVTGDYSDGSVDYFVWNNTTDPVANPSWNYFFQDQALFSATFGAGAVPEPASWAMMLTGFGLVGYAMRKARSRTTVAYA